jgi:hypothetical protein
MDISFLDSFKHLKENRWAFEEVGSSGVQELQNEMMGFRCANGG